MKKLPAGESSFSEIRQGDWLYIDKTEVIHKLLQEGKFYFLSRPRRFGKSLTVSTLKAIFEGRKDLFEGLWIYDQLDWQEKYPVILLSFNGIDYKTHGLEKALTLELDKVAAGYELQLEGTSSKDKFKELIERLSERENVVILIDEYDKPINDFLHEFGQADQNRGILGNFFGVLKDAALVDHIRFVFLTGVSKFSKVTLFSELNNLTDLTLHPGFSTLLGITQQELETYFAEHIEAMCAATRVTKSELLRKIRHWYNGYTWDGENFVYNPFSMIHLFHRKKFSNYWFQSGTTSWLVKNLYLKQTDLPGLENMVVGPEFFEKFDIANIDFITLLYQTGYLTIKSIEVADDDEWYTLNYPNHEVRNSLLKNLFEEYAHIETSKLGETMRRLDGTLRENDLPAFIEHFKTIFADISNRMLRQYVQQNSLQLWEAYYQTVVYIALNLTGSRIASEVQTNKGYIDAVVETDKYVNIMEFKVGKAKDAMQQIKDKGYFEKFLGKGKIIQLLGIGFDPEERNIGDWDVQPANK